MPAIQYLRGRARPTDRRPNISRHIVCLPNKQRLRQRWSRSRDVMQDAGEDSAARTEADDERILRDCPCGSKPIGGKRESLAGQVPCERILRFFCSPHAAIAAQQSCSINGNKSLVRRNGMSKTTMWKMYAESGTSQMRKRSLRGMPLDRKS